MVLIIYETKLIFQLHLLLARVERRDYKPGRRLLRGVRDAVGLQHSPHHRRDQEVAGFHASLADHKRWLDRHLPCEFTLMFPLFSNIFVFKHTSNGRNFTVFNYKNLLTKSIKRLGEGTC